MEDKDFTLPGVFFSLKSSRISPTYFTCFYSMVKLLWEIREQGLLSITRTVAGFHSLPWLK